MSTGDCAAACLAMIVSHHGRKTSLSECRTLIPTGRDGASARALAEAARRFGLAVRAISIEMDDLRSLALPAIIHWQFNHFVVVERCSKTAIRIVDPARGRVTITSDEFSNAFTGIALVLHAPSKLKAPATAPEPGWRHYFRHLRPRKRLILLVLACSLLVQLAGLAVPVVTLFAVDRVIPTANAELLPLLLVAAVLLVANQLIISNLRERVLVYLKAHLDLQATTSFLAHLLSLPLAFFDRRGSGDLLGRLTSNARVRETLSTPLLAAVLDATFALVYLALLVLVDPAFAAIVVLLALIHSASVAVLTRKLRARLQQELFARAESHDFLAQAFSGIAALKASGGERRALDYWTPLMAKEVSATVAVNRLQATAATASAAFRLMSALVLLVLGTHRVVAGDETLGVMFALIALATAFLTPVAALVSHFEEIRRATAHLDRVVDVLNARPEQPRSPRTRARALTGAIELNNVSFSYGGGADLAVRDVSLTVAPGAKVAIVGRTGSGKSTLARLILGLYVPTRGEVRFDGTRIDEYDLRELRNQFGVVLQDPALFAGTIRQNIAFHCPDAPLDAVVRAARIAAIDEEIRRMPLGYDTPIMPGGGGLSGGQRQRIALAQAAARGPAILVLDEATSHLDTITERRIDQQLNRIRCTRIVIAHRLSTIRDADCIVVLDEGEVVEQGKHAELASRRGRYWELVERQLERERQSPALAETTHAT
jgi:ATP-binding cassette, subfamily B, bacterial